MKEHFSKAGAAFQQPEEPFFPSSGSVSMAGEIRVDSITPGKYVERR